MRSHPKKPLLKPDAAPWGDSSYKHLAVLYAFKIMLREYLPLQLQLFRKGLRSRCSGSSVSM